MVCGRKRDVDIWRAVVATSGTGSWGDVPTDPVYEYHHTMQAVMQPFEASDGNRNNERFSNVRHILTAALDEDIQDYDETVIDEIHRRVVYVETFDNGFIDHLEIYIADAQYERE